MRTMNKITLIGRLGRDPEMKLAQNGTHWTVLAVATNRNRKDGDKWVEETDWHQVKCFGKDAEYVGKYCKKGSIVSIEGEVHYETWQDKDNGKRWSAKVYADRVGMLAEGRSSGDARGPAIGVVDGVEAASA